MSIIEANNRGIALLVEGRYEEAEHIFHAAAAEILRIMMEPSFEAASEELFSINRCQVNPIPVDRQPKDHASEITAPEDHNTCFLYEKAMEIIPPLRASLTAHPSKVRKNQMYLSAVVMYNIGLVGHLRGKTEADRRSHSYQVSLNFYGKAAELIRAISQTLDDETDDLLLLRMAIFNNMAHLNFHYYDLMQSRICLTLVEDTLMRCTNFLEDHEVFNINLIVSEDQEHRVAPAA